MKTTQLFKLLSGTAVILAATNPVAIFGQTYQWSAPMVGLLTESARDVAGSSSSSSGLLLNFGTFSETVYVDQAAQTVRQVGQITVSPSAPSIVINEVQQVPGQFPNPPQSVSGAITIYTAPAGGNILSFDTGPRSISWDPASQLYRFDGTIRSLATTFSGSYSLVTGGQTYGGSISYNLSYNPAAAASAYTFDEIRTTGYPGSIALSGLGNSDVGGILTAQPAIVADVTAANGFHMQLGMGMYSNFGVYGENWGWSNPGIVTAYLVPEPSSIGIIATLASIALWRRRQCIPS